MKTLIVLSMLLIAVGCGSSSKPSGDAKSTPAKDKPSQPSAKATEAKASKSAGDVAQEKSCTSGKDVRKLTIQNADGGCELHYEKFGEDNVVATAKSGTDYCQEVMSRISSNLEAAGFSCQ